MPTSNRLKSPPSWGLSRSGIRCAYSLQAAWGRDNVEATWASSKLHRNAVEAYSSQQRIRYSEDEARQCWTGPLPRPPSRYRNAQVTVLAPDTGTIAFLMDCDTTGVEPDIGVGQI